MSPRPKTHLTVEHIVLYLLDKKPMHGYELHQTLCAMPGISLIWNVKQALLYAILDKLEAQGYIASPHSQEPTSPPRKTLRLTELGKSSLQTWLKTPVRRGRDFRQEFLAKLIIARQYGTETAMALLEAQQAACQAWQQELQATASGQVFDTYLVYSFRMQWVNMILEWLNTCRDAVQQLPLAAEQHSPDSPTDG